MSNSEFNFFESELDQLDEKLYPNPRNVISINDSRSTTGRTEFCPHGWDERIEDYHRGLVTFESDENALLDHLFGCEYCAEHVRLLDGLVELRKTIKDIDIA